MSFQSPRSWEMNTSTSIVRRAETSSARRALPPARPQGASEVGLPRTLAIEVKMIRATWRCRSRMRATSGRYRGLRHHGGELRVRVFPGPPHGGPTAHGRPQLQEHGAVRPFRDVLGAADVKELVVEEDGLSPV